MGGSKGQDRSHHASHQCRVVAFRYHGYQLVGFERIGPYPGREVCAGPAVARSAFVDTFDEETAAALEAMAEKPPPAGGR